MYSYCTLFDINYLTRGLCMYESLKSHTKDFHLFIFAFCDKSYELLKKLDLESCTIIALQEFEDDELLKIKSSRSAGEYCWTCTPSIIKYCLDKYNLSHCTYLDADLYFFDNPNILIDEMKTNDVSITEHRYTKIYDQSSVSGIYCVQFMTFKNTLNGINILNWWRNACNEWCYARVEDGKFGDQKYLDDWMDRFSDVYIISNSRAGVAPWNVQQYDFKNRFDIIFYHFHNLKFLDSENIYFGNYYLSSDVVDKIYRPYVKHLYQMKKRISVFDTNLNLDEKYEIKKNYIQIMKKVFQYNLMDILKKIIIKMKKNENIFKVQDLIRG